MLIQKDADVKGLVPFQGKLETLHNVLKFHRLVMTKKITGVLYVPCSVH